MPGPEPEPGSPKPTNPLVIPKSVEMNPKKLKNVRKNLISLVPDYNIMANLDTTTCNIEDGFKGDLIVRTTESKIKSVELQLVRVESCYFKNEGTIKEATEIQNLQVGDGNLCKGLSNSFFFISKFYFFLKKTFFQEMKVPLFMVFPRLFSCPTVIGENFKIEFDMNVIVLFVGGHQVTENIHIHLYRPKDGKKKNSLYLL